SGLAIQAKNDQVAVALHQPGEFPPESVTGPLEALKSCEGTRRDPVTFEQHGDQVVVQWSDRRIPQVAQFRALEPEGEFPAMPDALQANPPELLQSLVDAVETTDQESSRYALGCLQLRGARGGIAATDGRQLLLQSGFQFPWEEDL